MTDTRSPHNRKGGAANHRITVVRDPLDTESKVSGPYTLTIWRHSDHWHWSVTMTEDQREVDSGGADELDEAKLAAEHTAWAHDHLFGPNAKPDALPDERATPTRRRPRKRH
jgi:hypothetical protein